MGGRVLIAALVALAASPATAGSYQLMFDIFSPGGIECAATPPPGGAVKLSRGIAGNPVVSVFGGELRRAEITCTLPDGSRWQAVAHHALKRTVMHAEGMVAIRSGAPHGITMMRVDGREDVATRSFLPLR